MKRKRDVCLWVAVACSLAVACGPRLHAGDGEAARNIAEAIVGAGEDVLPQLVLQAMSEVDLGHTKDCRRMLGALAGIDPSMQATLLGKGLGDCEVRCIGAPDRLATLAPPERGAFAVAECDRAGADRVFDEVASLRVEMEPLRYLVLRRLLDDLRVALERDGSSEAKATWARWRRQLPRLGVALVRLERARRPGEAAPAQAPTPDPPVDERNPDGDTPLVVIAAAGTRLDGSAVTDAALGGGLRAAKEGFATRHPGVPFPGNLVLSIAGDVPFSTVKGVLSTLAAAGYFAPQLALPVHDRSFRAPRWSGRSAAPLVLATRPAPPLASWNAPRPSWMTAVEGMPARAPQFALALDGDGYALSNGPGDPARIAKSGGAYDRAQLAAALGRLREMEPHLHAIAVAATDGVRWRDVLAAADGVVTAGYPDVVLASLLDEPPPTAAEIERRAAAVRSSLMLQLLSSPTGVSQLESVFKQPVGLRHTDAGIPTPPATAYGPHGTVTLGAITVDGALSIETMRREIARRQNAVRSCYERALKRNPAVAGHIDVQFDIETDGHVTTPTVTRSTIAEPEVEQCMTSMIRLWRLPPPSGARARVTCPFTFTHP